MSAPVTAYRKAWLKWKALRLPWRKRFLAGLDLDGNTYWEFRDTLSPGRMRRIVDYPPTVHYSDVTAHITPAWHQWLRHTRSAPPSLAEQAADVARLRHVKVLAAQADARWAAKKSYLDAPAMAQAQPALGTGGQVRLGGDVQAQKGTLAGTPGDVGEGGRPVGGETGKAGAETGGRRSTNAAALAESMQERPAEPRPPAKADPWQTARGGRSEEWQPAAWSPKPRS